MYYSKTNNAFYDDPKYYPIVPSDLIQITDQECKYLLEQQSKGKIIKAGSNGKPIAVTPPSPTLQ